jgi:hypothetical protein
MSKPILTPQQLNALANMVVNKVLKFEDVEPLLKVNYESRFPGIPNPSWAQVVANAGGPIPPGGDWTPLTNAMNGALEKNGLLNTNDLGACVYFISGQEKCANLTSDQCAQLQGAFDPTHLCS